MLKKIVFAIMFVFGYCQFAFASSPLDKYPGEFGPVSSVYGQRLGSIYNYREIYKEVEKNLGYFRASNVYFFHSSNNDVRLTLNWLDPEEFEDIVEKGAPDIYSIYLSDNAPKKVKNEFEGMAMPEEDIIQKMSTMGYSLVKKQFSYFNQEYNSYDISIIATPDRISSILFSSNIIGAGNITANKLAGLIMEKFKMTYADQEKLEWIGDAILYKEAEKGYEIRFTQPDNSINRFLIELKAIEVFDGLKF